MDRSLNIGIYGHGVPFDGDTLHDQALGGSESMYIMMSEALKSRGHHVTVLTLGGRDTQVCGVNYLNYLEHRERVLGGMEFDVFLIGRDFSKLTQNVRTKMLGLWNHDVLTDEKSLHESIYATDFMFCLSDFHRSQFLSKSSHIEKLIHTTRNGINIELLDSVSKDSIQKEPHSFVYGSRPERGLVYLLYVLWPKVLERIPDAKLYVAGYDVAWERLPDDVKRIHEVCNRGIESYKDSVIRVGNLRKVDWYRLLYKCQMMLYPTGFPEIGFINGIEAQACEVDVISTHNFAIPECTYNESNLIQGMPYQGTYLEDILDTVCNLDGLWNAESREGTAHSRNLQYAKNWIKDRYSVQRIAEEWEELFWYMFRERATTKSTKVIKQLIHHSDLLAAKYILESTDYVPEEETPELLEEINGFLKRQHEEPELYHDFVDNDVMKENNKNLPGRMQAALHFIRSYINRNRGVKQYNITPLNARQIESARSGKIFKLLDVGCGGGRFLYNAAKELGSVVELHGVDFSSKLIYSAQELLAEEGFSDVGSRIVYSEFFDYTPPFPFDILFCGEWLEHQQEPYRALEKLLSLLVPGGLLVLTVPSGNWESISFGEARNSKGEEIRFHVSHFEMRDVATLFKEYDHEITFDPLGVNRDDGSLLGNWVVAVNKGTLTGKKIHHIDYEKKFLLTRPYQFVSAAIIARDAENDILRMVKSIERHVDEVVILDTGSKDNTKALVQDRQKVKVYDTSWPNDFSLARNRSVSLTSPQADWILWVDCDEVVVNAIKLRKYVQSLVYPGFIILQHHLSIDSEQAPDVPVRLYRKDQGFYFYGKVHEQVQKSLNEIISPTLILSDVHVVHYGYLTESQRRTKVQQRNLPLLIQDRRENPDRKLGAILLMRDLLQIVAWTQESRQSLFVDEDMLRKIYEVLSLYDDFRDIRGLYHPLAWVHYQKALQLLYNGQLTTPYGQRPFAMRVLLSRDEEAKPTVLYFASVEDMQDWFFQQVDRIGESLNKNMILPSRETIRVISYTGSSGF